MGLKEGFPYQETSLTSRTSRAEECLRVRTHQGPLNLLYRDSQDDECESLLTSRIVTSRRKGNYARTQKVLLGGTMGSSVVRGGHRGSHPRDEKLGPPLPSGCKQKRSKSDKMTSGLVADKEGSGQKSKYRHSGTE